MSIDNFKVYLIWIPDVKKEEAIRSLNTCISQVDAQVAPQHSPILLLASK